MPSLPSQVNWLGPTREWLATVANSFRGAALTRVSLGCHSTTGSVHRTTIVGLACLWRSVSSSHCREVPLRNSTSILSCFSWSTKLGLATTCHHKLKRVCSLSPCVNNLLISSRGHSVLWHLSLKRKNNNLCQSILGRSVLWHLSLKRKNNNLCQSI